jgi:hypothetical protein
MEEIRSQLMGNCEMGVDLFNAWLRRIQQIREENGETEIIHFFEAEFLVINHLPKNEKLYYFTYVIHNM